MDISEMHKMFRQYAQQMGMQNVRAILPEQIDLFINNSISDTINQVITQFVYRILSIARIYPLPEEQQWMHLATVFGK